MSKRKIGIIGMGSIGKVHARHLGKLGHEVHAYDPLVWSGLGTSIDILWHPEEHFDDFVKAVEAIVIASPTNLHCRHISDIGYGKPFFIEKPVGATQGDWEFLSDRQWLPGDMIGYNLRFHSCVQKAKQWIDGGLLGEPWWANFVCAQKNTKYQDHVILNWSHEIDLAQYLLGPATVRRCYGYANIADIIMNHGDNTQSTIHLDYITEPEIRQDVIVGDKATIIMDLVNRQAWIRDTKNNILDHFIGEDSWPSNYLDEMETWLARLDGTETVGCTGKEGLSVLRLCLDAISSTVETSRGSLSIF